MELGGKNCLERRDLIFDPKPAVSGVILDYHKPNLGPWGYLADWLSLPMPVEHNGTLTPSDTGMVLTESIHIHWHPQSSQQPCKSKVLLSHFTDVETKAQREEGFYPRSRSHGNSAGTLLTP